MTISTHKFGSHNLSAEENRALEKTMEVISMLQDKYSEDATLTSFSDDEFITIEELKRVQGILSFIRYNKVVEVAP